jgi:hypothetical protein
MHKKFPCFSTFSILVLNMSEEEDEPLFPTEVSGQQAEFPIETPDTDTDPTPVLSVPDPVPSSPISESPPSPKPPTPPLEISAPDPEPESVDISPSPPPSDNSSPKRTPNIPSPEHSRQIETKPITRRISWREEFANIPKPILYNPHVARRLNICPPSKATPPRAALSHAEYRSRSAGDSPLSDFSQSLLKSAKAASDSEVTVEQLRTSSYELKTLERMLVLRADYFEARKAAAAYDNCQSTLRSRLDNAKLKSSLTELVAKRDELVKLVEQTRADYEEMLKAHDDRTADLLHALLKQQKAEMDGFERAIPADLTPQFKRHSVTYWATRSKEKNLGKTRQFVQAHHLKTQADKLEQYERGACFQQMDGFYRDRKERMKQRHALMIENFWEYNDQRRRDIELKRDQLITGYVARAAGLDKRIQQLIAPNSDKHGCLSTKA